MSKAPSGFVIDSIDLEGFMRYKDPTKISFPGQFTAITGPTGSGKSSILDAMTFALYGASSRTDERLKVEDFVDKNGHVRLEFYQGGSRFEVVRGRKAGRSYLALNQNLKSIGGSTTEIQREIINIVGLDYIGFRNSTFIRQDEMKAIGSETGAQRLDIFQRLFRLEVFEKAQKIADERLKETRDAALQASTKVVQMKISYEKTLPQKRNYLETAKTLAGKLKEEADGLKRKTATLKKQVAKLQPIHDTYIDVSSSIETLKGSIEENKEKIEEAEEKNRQRNALKQEIDRLRKAAEEHSRLTEQENGLERKGEKVSNIEEKIAIRRANISRINESLQTQSKGYRTRLAEYEKRLKSVQTSLSKDEAFDYLRLEGALKERIHRIDTEMKWMKEKRNIVEQLKKEGFQASRQLPVISAKTKSITGDVFLKTEIQSYISRLDEDLTKVRSHVKDQTHGEEGSIAELEREKRALGFTPSMKATLGRVRERLAEIESDASAYLTKRDKLDKLPDQRSLIRELQSSSLTMKRNMRRLEEQELKLRKHEENYNTLYDELQKIQEKISKATQEAGEAKGKWDQLKTQVEELEKLKPEIDKLERSTKELTQKQEIYTILKEEVFHRKGILIYAINQLLQGMSREASFILGELTDRRLNNIRVTPYSDTRGGGVRIEVEGVDGLFHDVSIFSGGEKTQVNAALRFSIAKELASMPQVGKSYGNMKTLFIDEGDLGSLDTEQSRKLFIKKLFTLGDLFEKIILITQLTEIADQFPSRIRVYMTPEQFSRIAEGAPQNE